MDELNNYAESGDSIYHIPEEVKKRIANRPDSGNYKNVLYNR
jgi:hypothetical protein